MKPKYTNMVLKKGQFIGRPIEMGKHKRIIIIPKEYYKDIDSVMNKQLKISWEEIVESK